MADMMKLGGAYIVLPRHMQVVFLEFLSENGSGTTISLSEEDGGVHRALFDGKVGINHIPDSENVGNPIGVFVLLDADPMMGAGILEGKFEKAGIKADIYPGPEDSFFAVVCEEELIAFKFIPPPNQA